MGPQLDSCGREPKGRPDPDAADASMGPQLDSCGRINLSGLRFRSTRSLQWGRNLIVAEGTGTAADTAFGTELQWGRNLIVAEG